MQERALPFDTEERSIEVVQHIIAAMPQDERPHLVEFSREHVLKPGYDYGQEFEWGLDLVLDGLIVRPWVSRLVLAGGDSRSELVHSSAPSAQRTTVSGGGTVRVYDARGTLRRTAAFDGVISVLLPAGGFAITER